MPIRLRNLIGMALACAAGTASGDVALAEEKAVIIGKYFAANDILRAGSGSVCQYVFKGAKVRTETALVAEVRPYLTISEEAELAAFLASEKWAQKRSESDRFFQQGIAAFRKDGIDENTACGMLSSLAAQTISAGNAAWAAFLRSNAPLR